MAASSRNPLRDRVARLLLAGALAVLAVQVWSRVSAISTAAWWTEPGRAGVAVPPGFAATVFADGLAAPRFLSFGPDGLLYVAESGAGRIVALGDSDGDGLADVRREFAGGLGVPHDAVWHDSALYAGVPTGVVELRDTDGDGAADARRVLVADYPTPGHSSRSIVFLPDGRMVVSVGSSCNVCEEDDPRRAALVVYDGASAANGQVVDGASSPNGRAGDAPSAANGRVFARGLRNAVGLALHPRTGTLWATNNGRDWLGDDLPPDTIQAVADGDDFGWPRCHAGDLVDPEYGGERGCAGVKAPAVKLQAHSAPLGLAFCTGDGFPAAYRGDLFVALHGSWNRSVPTGFKVVRVRMDGDAPTGVVEDFATGFHDTAAARVLGRPVGVAFGPDGALYVSDDKGGFVYRIAWRG